MPEWYFPILELKRHVHKEVKKKWRFVWALRLQSSIVRTVSGCRFSCDCQRYAAQLTLQLYNLTHLQTNLPFRRVPPEIRIEREWERERG